MTVRTSSAIGWMSRYVLLPALVAMVGLIAIGGYMAYRDHRIRAFTGDVRPFLAEFGIQLPAYENQVQRVGVDVPPPAPAPAVSVNSYPPDALYPLEAWQVVNNPAGFIDWIKVDGVVQPIDRAVEIGPGQIIEIGGWAGHRLLGMRFEEVLLSVCEIVIAGAPVDGERPDIAVTIHPNLGQSGWRASLFASDIPSCAEAEIRAWGRPPVGTTLRPIVGGRDIRLIDEDGPSQPERTIAHVTPAVLPEQAPSPVTLALENLTPPLVMRRCADAACSALAEVVEPIFDAVVVERGSGWLLLQSAFGSGWVQAASVVPAP